MCYRQTPSQHTQDTQRQAKDDAKRKVLDRQEQREERVERSREKTREQEVETE